MKLLIITQKVDENDQLLGFFIEWIKRFSFKFESIKIICLWEGKHSLPKNVEVLSLGKERGVGRIGQLFNLYKYVWSEKKNYDSVFVHMNPGYVLYVGWLWKILGKKITLWYAHGHVDLKLKIATALSDIIFTSTRDGFRINSSKVRIVGQGIDTDVFKPDTSLKFQNPDDKIKIITVGRISPLKDYVTLIRAIDLAKKEIHKKIIVDIIGSPVTESDKEYLTSLISEVEARGLGEIFNFRGMIPNRDIVLPLQSADLFVNMGHTGSLDKAILEAMACGLPILTCNEALADVLGKYASVLMFNKSDCEQLARKITLISNIEEDQRRRISSDMRAIVVEKHNINNLIDKMSQILIKQ